MKIRCSELDRILACPGSITLTQVVEPRAGDEAAEGTDLHALSARTIIRDLGATGPEDGIAAPDMSRLSFSHWISDFYVRHVRETVPADWSLEVECPLAYEFECGPRMVTVVDWVDGRPVLTEKQIGLFVLSGHIDCVAISPDGTAVIGWDLKTGYDPVDVAEYNWQILGYIVLLKRAYPQLTTATFYIVQPRNDEDEGFPRVSPVTLTLLDEAVATLTAEISRALDNLMEVNSGRKQCRWCPASGPQCPANVEEMQIMKVTLTPAALAAVKRTPDDAQLGDWVISGRTLARSIDDAEKLLHERLDTTGSLTAGCGTVITRKTTAGSYEVPDPVTFFAAVKQLLPADASLAGVMKPSMTKIKDEIAQVMSVPKTGKGPLTAASIFDGKLRPLVEQGERRLLVFSQ